MKHLVALFSFFFLTFSSAAYHLIGGDITCTYLSANTFDVKLTVFRDCTGTTGAPFDGPNLMQMGVYDLATNSLVLSFTPSSFSQSVPVIGDECYTPALCIEEGTYHATINLPNNSNGYYIVWERCCRNTVIQNLQNPDDAGMVFYCAIADPALANSSPDWGPYPVDGYWCVGNMNLRNFSATDIDGDQLVYSLVTPMNGHTTELNPLPTTSQPAPYPPVTWQSPYGLNNSVHSSEPITINGELGVIETEADQLGVFVLAVMAEEYRDGVKIGEIRRDVQFQALNCTNNLPPVFDEITLGTISAGEEVCFPVVVSENNWGDSIYLQANSELFNGYFSSSFTPASGTNLVEAEFCWQTSCNDIREAPYSILFTANDNGCASSAYTDYQIEITLSAGPVLENIPNVFSPNGDGKNDVYTLLAGPSTTPLGDNPCLTDFSMLIYNRWGKRVYKSDDIDFNWEGDELEEGVYFYHLHAQYFDQQIDKRGQITLFR